MFSISFKFKPLFFKFTIFFFNFSKFPLNFKIHLQKNALVFNISKFTVCNLKASWSCLTSRGIKLLAFLRPDRRFSAAQLHSRTILPCIQEMQRIMGHTDELSTATSGCGEWSRSLCEPDAFDATLRCSDVTKRERNGFSSCWKAEFVINMFSCRFVMKCKNSEMYLFLVCLLPLV